MKKYVKKVKSESYMGKLTEKKENCERRLENAYGNILIIGKSEAEKR